MSRSSFAVRFPDGVIKYGICNDTVGRFQPPLFDQPNDAWVWWEAYRKNKVTHPDFTPGDGEAVEVCDNVGHTHVATATRMCLTSMLSQDEVFDVWSETQDGLPEPTNPEWARPLWDWQYEPTTKTES